METVANQGGGPQRSLSEGGSLRLVAVRPEWVEAWLSWRRETSARRFLDEQSRERLMARLRSTSSDLRDRQVSEYRWMIEFEDKLAGTVSLRNLSGTLGDGDLGYLVAERFQGRGLATRAMSLLIDKAFTERDLHRLSIRTARDNEGSSRLAVRLGFKHEGTLREHYLREHHRVDQLVYGLLRSEWDKTRTAARQ